MNFTIYELCLHNSHTVVNNSHHNSHTVVKNTPASTGDARDMGSVPGSGRSPGEGNGNPVQYFCLEKSHGQWSLVGYCPRGGEEPNMTEHTHTHTHKDSSKLIA